MTTTVNPERFMRPILDYGIPITGDRDGRTKGDAIQIGGEYSPGKCAVRNPSEPRKWDKRTGWGLTGATAVYIGDDLAEFDVDFYLWTQPQQTEWDTYHDKWLTKPMRKPALNSSTTSAQAKQNAIAQQQLINDATQQLARPDLTPNEKQTIANQRQSALSALQAQQNGGQSFLFPPQPKALGISHPSLAKAKITAVVVTNVTGPDDDDYGGIIYTVRFMVWQPPTPMFGRPDAVIPGAKLPTPTPTDQTELDIQKTLAEITKANDNLARGGK